MINVFLSSENENNSIDNRNFHSYDNKEKELNSFLSPYLTTIEDFRQFNEPFELLLEKDYKEISGLLPSIIKNNNIIEEERVKEILEKTIHNNYLKKFIIKKSKPVFNIKKELKLGRPKKYSFKRGKHDKYQKDNVIRRFKAQFVQNLNNYINISFRCNSNHNKKPINVLQKICACDTKSISKNDNLKWFNSKIRDIFSQKISSKFVCYESNYNNQLIKTLYEKNEEKRVLEILERTVKEMWIVYIRDDKNNYFPGFNTIKYDVLKFRQLNEPDEYIQLYIYICSNFENIFNKIKPRKKKNNAK